MVTPGAKREAVAHAREHHGVSEPKEQVGGVPKAKLVTIESHQKGLLNDTGRL
jgi:hypothetical protein